MYHARYGQSGEETHDSSISKLCSLGSKSKALHEEAERDVPFCPSVDIVIRHHAACESCDAVSSRKSRSYIQESQARQMHDDEEVPQL